MSVDSRRDPLGISGTIIADKYRIGGVIGEGGFSVVYQAEHTIWQQPVAIKCFKILANAPADQRDRLLDGFIQEGKLMAQLSSRSAAIVQARDVGTFTSRDGQWIPYMVLEWLDGKPLDVVVWEETRAGLPPRTLPEAMALLEPAAVALEIVHARGIAHRDIKPANFFVLGNARGPDVYVKVLDFGIAKVMAEHAEIAAHLANTGTEITSFTPNYGAPEQFSRSHGATGPWTDVFAMALILIEILRGGKAALDGNDFMQMAIASRDPNNRPTPRAFGLQVTDAVERVFHTALAVAPASRYASMGQFWGALSHAVFPEAPTWTGAPSGTIDRMNLAALGGSMPQPSPATGAGMVRGGTVLTPASAPTPMGAPATGMPMSPLSSPQPGSNPSLPQPGSNPSLPQPGYNPSLPQPGYNPSVPQPGYNPSLPVFNQPAVTPAAPAASSKAPLAVAGIAVVALAVGGVMAYRVFGGGPAGPEPAASGSAVVAAASASASTSASASVATAPRRTDCPEGTVLISGGKFFMGSDEPGFKLWQPAHKVTLDTFCIDLNEVTAGEYKACSDVGECKRPDPIPDYPKPEGVSDEQHEKNRNAYGELCNFGKEGREKHPINCVSWALADSYCKWKKRRLPTEAEWEYAARGSDGRKFPWGDEAGDATRMNACGTECNKWETAHGLKPSPRMFNADDGYPGTAPVGSFPKGQTKFGANDFVGNVWEWTADWFETYKADEAINPRGAPAGEKKAIRGGGFNGGVQLWLNPAFRYHQIATASAPAIGLRCATNL